MIQCILTIGAAVLLLLAVAGAARGGAATHDGCAERQRVPAEPPVTLAGTRWVLMRAALPVAMPAYGIRTTLDFSEVDVQVRSGCTAGNGRYEIAAWALVTGDLKAVNRPCAGGQRFDRALMAALSARPALHQTCDELVLEAASGKLEFRAEAGPSAHAMRKIIYVAPERKACMGNVAAMCLQIRSKAAGDWMLFYDGIIDFTPQPGVEYRLRILEDPVPNPPMDAPSSREFIDAVLWARRVAEP
jgi:heat shock protein HslJ